MAQINKVINQILACQHNTVVIISLHFSVPPHSFLPAPIPSFSLLPFFFNISMALDQDTYFQAAFSLLVLYFTQAPSPWPGRPPLGTPSVLFTLQGKGHVSAAAGSLHSHRSHFFPLHVFFPRAAQAACCYVILCSKGWASANIKQKWTLKAAACVS